MNAAGETLDQLRWDLQSAESVADLTKVDFDLDSVSSLIKAAIKANSADDRPKPGVVIE